MGHFWSLQIRDISSCKKLPVMLWLCLFIIRKYSACGLCVLIVQSPKMSLVTCWDHQLTEVNLECDW